MSHGSLALLDYRRQVASHYAKVRAGVADPEASWQQWRTDRDALFKHHSQSPLLDRDRSSFDGLKYYDYDPQLRFVVELHSSLDAGQLGVELNQDGPLSLQVLGSLHFKVAKAEVSLTAYWLSGYGGGLFLPFRDATNGHKTYGGGRYLLDTIKGADLGTVEEGLILDFNFAYNPSCAYNPRWHCPLAPAENWLDIEIAAGEMDFSGEEGTDPDPSAIPSFIGSGN